MISPEWTLKLVGYLPEKEHFRSLYEHVKQIEFVGPVMPEKIPRLMSECSMFVLPSRSEAMGRVSAGSNGFSEANHSLKSQAGSRIM